MTTGSLKDLMLVGSARAETAEEALTAFARAVGQDVSFLPDGEYGERRNFIMHLARRLYLAHPDLELISRPAPQGALRDVIRARSFKDNWRFRVKDGIDSVRFGEPGWRLGYAEPAISSYFVFRTLREKGEIPADVRFQVTMPLAGYGCYTFITEPADWPKVVPGYEEALRAEIANIADKIPQEDLVFQFDQVAVFHLPGAGEAGDSHAASMTRERYGAAIANVAPAIPGDALLGFHLCYGGLEGWPSRRPPLSSVVAAANLVAESAGRRVDYIHLPLLPKQDAAYFEALRDLEIGAAKLFLGVIHGMSDRDDFRFRVEQARRNAPPFGVAAPCGTRAMPLADALQMHREALDLLAGAA